ncbi:MAG: MerR family transcriptional regulator [Variovorax sp.]|nr:MAG: MerR family transcriptional regulator [Variovorax sp.]
MATAKAEGAFLTISELSGELGVPQHVLRYWETRFPQLRPLTRAGNRRYYRPADVALARRIHRLLSHEGYTVRGEQLLHADKEVVETQATPVTPPPLAEPALDPRTRGELEAVRALLVKALDAGGPA